MENTYFHAGLIRGMKRAESLALAWIKVSVETCYGEITRDVLSRISVDARI